MARDFSAARTQSPATKRSTVPAALEIPQQNIAAANKPNDSTARAAQAAA